ncbi:hypothetical protein V6N13_124326 [Hibiscus sabdariffa]
MSNHPTPLNWPLERNSTTTMSSTRSNSLKTSRRLLNKPRTDTLPMILRTTTQANTQSLPSITWVSLMALSQGGTPAPAPTNPGHADRDQTLPTSDPIETAYLKPSCSTSIFH